MKWPWQRDPPPGKPGTEGAQARAQAEWHLEEAKSQWPEVHRVSSSLREIRTRNHFAEAIENVIRGRV